MSQENEDINQEEDGELNLFNHLAIGKEVIITQVL